MHLLIPSLCTSVTPSNHLNLARPTCIFPSGLFFITFFCYPILHSFNVPHLPYSCIIDVTISISSSSSSPSSVATAQIESQHLLGLSPCIPSPRQPSTHQFFHTKLLNIPPYSILPYKALSPNSFSYWYTRLCSTLFGISGSP